MPAVIVDWFDRKEIRNNPDKLYVFGDNFAREGFGGQAKECRGEPNAVGIPTKREPSREDRAYLSDADFDLWANKSAATFMRIAVALDDGKTVVWPSAGIGTGLAELERRAPKIWHDLQCRIASLDGPAKIELSTGTSK